jgi:hypothetical protein
MYHLLVPKSAQRLVYYENITFFKGMFEGIDGSKKGVERRVTPCTLIGGQK